MSRKICIIIKKSLTSSKNCDFIIAMENLEFKTEKMKAAMLLKGWKPKDLALEVNMTRQAIDAILKAGSTKVPTINKIARALGISPGILLN